MVDLCYVAGLCCVAEPVLCGWPVLSGWPVLCGWPVLRDWPGLWFPFLPACPGRAKRAPRDLLSLAFSGFPSLAHASSVCCCFPLLSLALLLYMISGIFFLCTPAFPPSLSLFVSCFSFPSFVFSRFTLCKHFFNKIALPVHLLRQVCIE